MSLQLEKLGKNKKKCQWKLWHGDIYSREFKIQSLVKYESKRSNLHKTNPGERSIYCRSNDCPMKQEIYRKNLFIVFHCCWVQHKIVKLVEGRRWIFFGKGEGWESPVKQNILCRLFAGAVIYHPLGIPQVSGGKVRNKRNKETDF